MSDITIDISSPGVLSVGVSGAAGSVAAHVAINIPDTVDVSLKDQSGNTSSITSIQVIPPVVFGSDKWMSLMTPCMDANGFVDWELFAGKNGYTNFYISPTEYQNYGSAQSAAQIVRATGKPVAVFERCGVFPNNISPPDTSSVELMGISQALPTIYASTYDGKTARPIHQHILGLGGKQSAGYLVLAGFDFSGNTTGDIAAISCGGSYPGSLWIENCNISSNQTASGFNGGIDFQEASSPYITFIIRRNTLTKICGNRWTSYILGVQDLSVIENFLDNNRPLLDSAKLNTQQTLYLQSWQLAATIDPMCRTIGNFIARASATGNEQRLGGLDQLNTYLGCPVAANLGNTGLNWTYDRPFVDAGGGAFNLITQGVNHGYGVGPNQVNGRALITGALCINKPKGTYGGTAGQALNHDNGLPTGGTDLVSCIVNNWDGLSWDPTTTGAGTTFKNCDLPGITGTGIIPTPKYKSLNTVDSYAKSLNMSGQLALLAAAALQERRNWNPKLMSAQIQAGVRAGYVPV